MDSWIGVFERNKIVSYAYIISDYLYLEKKKYVKKHVDYIQFGFTKNFSLPWAGILLPR